MGGLGMIKKKDVDRERKRGPPAKGKMEKLILS